MAGSVAPSFSPQEQDREPRRSRHAALAAWLDYLANERRASPRTVRAYGDGVAAYLAFLRTHLGGAPEPGRPRRAQRRRRARLSGVPAQRRAAAVAALGVAGAVGHPRLPPLARPAAGGRQRRPWPWCAARAWPRARRGRCREDQAQGLIETPPADPDMEDWEARARRGRADPALGLRPADFRGAVADRGRRAAGRGRCASPARAARPGWCRCCRRCARRWTPMSPPCRSALAPDEPLFRAAPRRRLLSPRHVQALMQRLRGRLGLPASATPHALRHSFATHLWAPAPTCARSRNCWATPRCRPPSATPTSTRRACWRSTPRPIRTREGQRIMRTHRD